MAIRIFDQTVGQTAGISVVTTGKGAITNDGLEGYAQMVVSASGQPVSALNIVSNTSVAVSDGSLTFNALNDAIVIDTQGFENASFTVSGFGTATMAVQFSNLTGSGFVAAEVVNINTAASATTITANGQYTAAIGGRYMRIICTAFTSGPIVVTPMLNAGGGSGSGGGGGGGGGNSTLATATDDPPTLVEGSTSNPLYMDLNGALRFLPQTPGGTEVDLSAPAILAGVTTSAAASFTNPVPTGYAQGSTTSGQGGPIVQGAVTTSAPTYTTGQTSPLSLTTGGALRVDVGSGGFVATGPTADDAAATGNPVQVAGKYTSTAPTFTDGDTAQLRLTAKGNLIVGGMTADDAAAPAAADTYPVPVGGIYLATPRTYTDGDRTQTLYTSRGELVVGGIVGSGATDIGNPVKVGARYNSTLPTVTDGQRVDLQTGTRGSLNVTIFAADSTNSAAIQATNSDAVVPSSAQASLRVTSTNYALGASNFERLRTIAGSFGSATGVLATEQAGASFRNITTATSTDVKTGAGILHKLIVGTLGAGSAVTLYNDTSGGTSNPIGVFNTGVERDIILDAGFSLGLQAVTAGGTPANITVVYR